METAIWLSALGVFFVAGLYAGALMLRRALDRRRRTKNPRQ